MTCARCERDAERLIDCYWPPHPRICPACCIAVAELLDEHNKWPPVDVPATPAEVCDA